MGQFADALNSGEQLVLVVQRRASQIKPSVTIRVSNPNQKYKIGEVQTWLAWTKMILVRHRATGLDLLVAAGKLRQPGPAGRACDTGTPYSAMTGPSPQHYLAQ